MSTRKTHQRPSEFSTRCAKRLLQQNRGNTGSGRLTVKMALMTQLRHGNQLHRRTLRLAPWLRPWQRNANSAEQLDNNKARTEIRPSPWGGGPPQGVLFLGRKGRFDLPVEQSREWLCRKMTRRVFMKCVSTSVK
jgi:hypothetical protein